YAPFRVNFPLVHFFVHIFQLCNIMGDYLNLYKFMEADFNVFFMCRLYSLQHVHFLKTT
ncbi:MAG: hypothetical protein RL463_859, partial [Bacteroidota bacterium]